MDNRRYQRYNIRGIRYEEISYEELKTVQGSGNSDTSEISEHTFSAKILMRGSGLDEQ